MHNAIAGRHFSRATLAGLAQKGIRLRGLTCIPNAAGAFLDSETGYSVDDNGCGRVWTFREVLAAAG